MPFPILKYYRSNDELSRFHQSLKQVACPHCQNIGYLILHGVLRGYTEANNTSHQKRGHRIYCSNRHRKTGCGKTFSILSAWILKGFCVGTKTLCRFLISIATGTSKIAALRKCAALNSASCAYRWSQCLEQAQSRLRTSLSRHAPPTHDILSLAESPLHHCKEHLEKTFPNSSCFIHDFQATFQENFL